MLSFKRKNFSLTAQKLFAKEKKLFLKAKDVFVDSAKAFRYGPARPTPPMPSQGPVTASWESPSSGFLKIPKALLNSNLSPMAQMTYIRLACLCDNKQPVFKKLDNLATQLDMSPPTFRTHRESLEIAGFLGVDESGTSFVLRSVPEEMEEIEIGFSSEGEIYAEEPEEEEVANPNYEEIVSRPRRKKTNKTSVRWNLMKTAWNKWKPTTWKPDTTIAHNWKAMSGVCNILKHLNLNDDDYDVLFRNVLLGASQNSFWMNEYKGKPTIYVLFNLEKQDKRDARLKMIEDLFESGQKIYDSKPKGYFFDWSNDEAILEMYNNSREQYKGTPFDIEWNSVYRFECSQRCADHYHKAVLEPLVANYLELDLTEDERRKYQVMEGDVLCEPRIRMRSELPDEIDSPAYTPGTVLICSHPETKEVLAWTLMSVPIPVSHDGDYMSRYTKELPLVIE